MLEIVLRPRAADDLRAIARYSTREWGVEQARIYLETIRRQVELVAKIPGIGSPAPGIPDGYRKARAGSHRIIYRQTPNQVVVVRILHEREDVPDDFNDFW